MSGVPQEVTDMVTEMQEKIDTLRAKNSSQQIELEAWRSGRLCRNCKGDGGVRLFTRAAYVDYPTIDPAEEE
jgi:hypothetical protein